jgi:hypothetical protein
MRCPRPQISDKVSDITFDLDCCVRDSARIRYPICTVRESEIANKNQNKTRADIYCYYVFLLVCIGLFGTQFSVKMKMRWFCRRRYQAS